MGGVNTVDVIAVQRFSVGLSTGIANVGKYQFTPTNRSYTGIVTNQTGQNYDTMVFGDVATGFVHRPEGPEGPSQPAAGDEMSGGEVASTVAAVALPEVAVDPSKSNFIVPVTTTEIDAKNKLVGFQGDLTFDERVVTFQSQPVQKAGLTGANWNVTGNVLAGAGPIRTLRVSAYSNDFTPLSGSGTLFELRMRRVRPGAQSTQLIWAAPPDDLIFIDADLNTQKPGNAAPGSVTRSSVGRAAVASPATRAAVLAAKVFVFQTFRIRSGGVSDPALQFLHALESDRDWPRALHHYCLRLIPVRVERIRPSAFSGVAGKISTPFRV